MSQSTTAAKRPRRAATPQEPPSPFRIQQAMTTLAETRERLLAIDPDMANDPELFADMLDGESAGDPFAVIERIIRGAIDAKYLADLAETRAKDLTARKARFERRSEVLRKLTLDMLMTLGLPKLEREDFTVSITTPLNGKVTITDDKAVPDEFCRIETTRTPSKTLIGDAIKAGADCPPGAVMGNPEPHLTIRPR